MIRMADEGHSVSMYASSKDAEIAMWRAHNDQLLNTIGRQELALKNMRATLQELRIRYRAAGRRPEECYEMSLIDEALRGESSDE